MAILLLDSRTIVARHHGFRKPKSSLTSTQDGNWNRARLIGSGSIYLQVIESNKSFLPSTISSFSCPSTM